MFAINSSDKITEIFPSALSVSRASDIPAFHSRWFMSRLREGGCDWRNPFNARQIQRVNFKQVRAIVFWSKNPAPLIPFLSEISESGLKFYFHYTLNNYPQAGTSLEPGVPSLEERVKTFKTLAEDWRVIWRYDPAVFGGGFTVDWHIDNIRRLIRLIGGSAEKLVFSFVDIYPRTAKNFAKLGSSLRGPFPDEIRQFAERLAKLRDKYRPDLALAACAESGANFKELGIEKSRCVDPLLINELCRPEEIFKPKWGKPAEPAQPGCGAEKPESLYKKDPGQRKECQCAPSKDIGGYRLHPCGHGCIYCYAGHGRLGEPAAANPL